MTSTPEGVRRLLVGLSVQMTLKVSLSVLSGVPPGCRRSWSWWPFQTGCLSASAHCTERGRRRPEVQLFGSDPLDDHVHVFSYVTFTDLCLHSWTLWISFKGMTFSASLSCSEGQNDTWKTAMCFMTPGVISFNSGGSPAAVTCKYKLCFLRWLNDFHAGKKTKKNNDWRHSRSCKMNWQIHTHTQNVSIYVCRQIVFMTC